MNDQQHQTPAQIGQEVTAQNPGGLVATGTYIGPSDNLPGFGRVQRFGPWFYDTNREYIGNFPMASIVPVTGR